MKSRKQRKLEAKQEGLKFAPQYNGKGVVGYDDFYGVGNERFNNKFVQFGDTKELADSMVKYLDDVSEFAKESNENTDVIDSDGLPWKEYEPSTEEKAEDDVITLNEVETKDLLKAIEVSKPVLEDLPKAKKGKKESKWKKKIKKLFNK